MSRGKQFESARRLFIFPANPVKTKSPRLNIGGFVSSRSAEDLTPRPCPCRRHTQATLTASLACKTAAHDLTEFLGQSRTVLWAAVPGGRCALKESRPPPIRFLYRNQCLDGVEC